MRHALTLCVVLILASPAWLHAAVAQTQDSDGILSAPSRVSIAPYPGQRTAPDPTSWSGTGWNIIHLEVITGQLDASSPLDPELINASDVAGLTPLHYAAAMGNLRPVQLLLEHGADVNASAYGGFSVLHAACQFGDTRMVLLLLDHGANAQSLFRGDWLWLTDGVLADDPQQLREGMQYMLSSKDWDAGISCLHLAAAAGNPELVSMMLKQSIDPGLPTLLNLVTPLHFCANSPDCTALLLAAGARPDPVEDFAGQSPLFSSSLENARLLLEAGANPDVLNSWGYGNLHMVESPVMAELLLDNGADIELRGAFGETPLMSAVDRGLLVLAGLLLARGAPVNSCDYLARTALDRANDTNHPELTELLVSAGGLEGFDLHPFHVAAAQAEDELMKLAIEAGEDVNGRDDCGWTALHYAAMAGSPATVNLLLSKGAAVDALDATQATPLTRCPLDPTELVQYLLEAKADPDAHDPWFGTALLRACSRGAEDAASLLVAAKADVNAHGPLGQTALMYAAQGGNAVIVQQLLDAGARPDDRDAAGMTALMHAAAYSSYYGESCTRILLSAGANVAAVDNRGRTVLHHLASRGSLQLAGQLVDAGCPHGLSDERGYTAARLARLTGNELLAAWLETLR